jgi:hypothetical protein
VLAVVEGFADDSEVVDFDSAAAGFASDDFDSDDLDSAAAASIDGTSDESELPDDFDA